jgi:DNA primase
MSQGFVSFAEVKRSVPMESVLVHYGLLDALTEKGQNLAGPCPFCKGKSARQFQVNLAKNAWYCFGCKAGGNVLDFVARREGLDVRGAALALSRWFELRLAESASTVSPPAAYVEALQAAEEAPPLANPPLAFTLKTLDPNHPNLASFGLETSTIEHFGAGYCTKGLLKGRLAIPIHNGRGELVAYAGLALQDGETPRYLFPPNFRPALEVMNLHRLMDSAEGDGRLYLVPEIEAVLRLRDAGVESVLGLFDGTLSPEQEESIKGILTLYEQLVLLGEGFEDCAVARLARLTSVRWEAVLAMEEA